MDHRRAGRTLGAWALVALLLAACQAAAPVSGAGGDAGATPADGEPVRIGALTSLTGPFAQWGVAARNGMELAAAELNAEGGVDGRPIELVERDTRGEPVEAVTALRGLIERDAVVAAGGIISSDVGLATADVAETEQVPLLLVKAGSEAVLTADSRYTFRTCLPAAPMTMQPVADYLTQEGLTRAGAIVADYAYGDAIAGAFATSLDAAGIDSQVEVAPVSQSDFTTALRALQRFDPDVIVATGHPPGAGAITSQSAELGIDTVVIGPWANYATIVDGVGAVAYDRFVDLDCVDYADPAYQDLAARYHERFDAFMEDDAVAGYAIVTVLAAAVGEVGDDREAIAAHLHDSGFDVPGFPSELRWTAWGELANATPTLSVIRQQEPPDGVNPGATWYPEALLTADPLEPYQPR